MSKITVDFQIVGFKDEAGHIDVEADACVEDVKKGIFAHIGVGTADIAEFKMFKEGGGKPMESDKCIRDAFEGGPAIVHVTKCNTVKVTVNYDNKQETLEVSPGQTVGEVKAEAVSKFKEIDDTQKGELRLRTGKIWLDEDAPIMKYAPAPRCVIEADLGKLNAPQGEQDVAR